MYSWNEGGIKVSWNFFTFGRQNEADIQMCSRHSLCRFEDGWIPGLDILLVSKMIHLLDPHLALPYRQLCLARGNKYREPLLGNWQKNLHWTWAKNVFLFSFTSWWFCFCCCFVFGHLRFFDTAFFGISTSFVETRIRLNLAWPWPIIQIIFGSTGSGLSGLTLCR